MKLRFLILLMSISLAFTACDDQSPFIPEETETITEESESEDENDIPDSEDNTEDNTSENDLSEDNTDDEDDALNGSMSATINGVETELEMASAGTYGVGFEYFIEGVTDNGVEFFTVSLFTNTLELGTYEFGIGVTENAASYSSAFGSAYLCGATEGSFTILVHDEENKRLEGTFEFNCFQASEVLTNGAFNVFYDF